LRLLNELVAVVWSWGGRWTDDSDDVSNGHDGDIVDELPGFDGSSNGAGGKKGRREK